MKIYKIFVDGKWTTVKVSDITVGDKIRIYHSLTGFIETVFNPLKLEDIITSCIQNIKKEAGDRISSLNWMLERAIRHESLGIIGKTTSSEVLQMQQDIEIASDEAENIVSQLTTIEEVQNFTW